MEWSLPLTFNVTGTAPGPRSRHSLICDGGGIGVESMNAIEQRGSGSCDSCPFEETTARDAVSPWIA